MEHDTAPSGILIQTLVFLAATCIVVPALRKARLSAVMGYLLIGVAMGPFVLGRLAGDFAWLSAFALEDSAGAHVLADLGVVFLLFIIGLEVSWERLARLRKFVFGLGLTQVALTTAIIAALANAFGIDPIAALVLGMAFSLSSTALVLQLLRERRQMAAPVGRISFSVLLMQDLMVVPILFALSAMEIGDGDFDFRRLGGLVLLAIAGIALILLVGRLVLRPLFRWVASIDSRETMIAAALLAAIGAGVAAEQAGLSFAMGAFLAGLILAETEFRHQIETDLEPFKDLLLGLFFVTVGMQIDPAIIVSEPVLIIAGVAALFMLKAAILAPLARALGVSWPRAIEIGFLLGQAGEFAFIVIGVAQRNELLPGPIADHALLITAVSIFITPVVASLGSRVARAMTRKGSEPPPEAAQESGHVVIAGFGRVGQMLGDILATQELAYVGVEANSDLIAVLRKEGRPAHFGDASRCDVLRSVGAANAAAIVVTMDRADAVERIVREVKREWPAVPVYARARDAEHAKRLHAAGADMASPDTVEAALQLGEALLTGIGVPDEAARRIIQERREAELARAITGAAKPG